MLRGSLLGYDPLRGLKNVCVLKPWCRSILHTVGCSLGAAALQPAEEAIASYCWATAPNKSSEAL
jgi:hypothetical protein